MSVVVFIETIFGAEPYMLPYKDTMIMMTHGINADRYTWFKPDSIGDIDEANGDSNLWWHYLNKELQIPKGYLQSYSFSSRSGRHEANMLEFGYSGYHNPASGEVETNGVIKQDIAAGIKFWEIFGTPIVDVNGKVTFKETKVKSGFPATSHHSWLEQAKSEYRSSLFNDPKINIKDPVLNRSVWNRESDIPDALLPSKLVMVSHSQGNIAVRGYLHSGRLARSGFFDHMAHPQPYAGYQSAMAALKDILAPGIGGILQLPSSRAELTPAPSDVYS